MKKIKEIRFEKLTLARDSKNIVENLDFIIGKGKYNLVGQNGIGKSSLLDCLYKVSKNYTGDIYLDEEKLKNINTYKLRKEYMGYVNQDVMLFDKLTIKENVHLLQGNEKFANKILEEVIQTLEVSVEQKVIELSGGQKQYINILLGIINDKPLLLIDEPFNNLSDNKVKKINELIEDTNKFIIVVSHKQIELKKINLKKRKLFYNEI